MTVECDKMTVNVLPERFERTVIALPWAGCGRSFKSAQRCADGHLHIAFSRRDVQMVTLMLPFQAEMQPQLVILLKSDVETSVSTIFSASQRICRLLNTPTNFL